MDVWCGNLLRFAFPRTLSVARRRTGAELFFIPVGGSGANEKISNNGDQHEQAEFHKELAMQLLPGRAVDNALHIFYANQSGRSGNAWFPGLCLAIDPNGQLIDEYLPS